jgi:ligand-binding sensor protein
MDKSSFSVNVMVGNSLVPTVLQTEIMVDKNPVEVMVQINQYGNYPAEKSQFVVKVTKLNQ